MVEQYKQLDEYPDVLSIELVAKYLNVSKDTVRKLCLTGTLQHVKIGRLYKITKPDIINFLEKK